VPAVEEATAWGNDWVVAEVVDTAATVEAAVVEVKAEESFGIGAAAAEESTTGEALVVMIMEAADG
jgi:hypothetical protein